MKRDARGPSSARIGYRLVVLLGGFCSAHLCPASAEAFERQWQLGASSGVTVSTHGVVGAGPVLSLDGAYGVTTDWDVAARVQGFSLAADGRDPLNAILVTAGGTYRFDVIEWVPRLGIEGGYYFANRAVGVGDDRLGPQSLVLSLVPGLDYSFSREFGVGIEGRLQSAINYRWTPTFLSALVHAEYRWGW